MPPHEDPLLTSARRETVITVVLWAAAMIYTVGVSVAWGYGRDPSTLKYVLGFPDWVFWGIVVPWLAFTLISAVFAMGVMQDAPLSDDEESTA
ncbi:MAG TPA: DUF997 family protein [Planctomycetaceae bacterium]|nr:DUF997 family protein [Planctomycetaceae bacterium]